MNRTTRQRLRLPRTEERLFPAARRLEDRMAAEHWARYRFASSSLSGRLLDVGCGTGYGSRELAQQANVREVVGIDQDEAALFWAERCYPDPRVSRSRVDLTQPGWEGDLGRFDAVLAFEILEHLAVESPFWDGIDRVLSPTGILWLSTPLGRGRGRPCADRFHHHQLRRSEVLAIFDPRWGVTPYGQDGCWIEPWVAGRRYYTMLVKARRRSRDGS